ncbi:MAG: alpha/beta hydrolase [Chitinophagales bacterium]
MGNGFALQLASPSENTSLVQELLAEGYVVVSMLYRLSRYGNTNTQMINNPITIDEQLDDIASAVNHIKNNFSTCLGVNASKMQIMGESAGAHLVLQYAYTRERM